MRLPRRDRRLLAFAFVLAACGPAPTSPFTDDAAAPSVDLARSAPPDLRAPADLASPCGPCAAPTPICDAKSKRCVACLVDGDCADQFICAMNACVPGCSAGHASCGDAGSCDVDMGRCRGCLSDAECKDPRAPFCDVVSGRCGACTPQNDRCPAGQYCGMQNGAPACVAGCKADIECQLADGGAGSSACCAHRCVDTRTAATDCGACGNDCQGGACCAAKCVDPQTDVKNCGACGKVCPSQNNVPTCAAGVCGSAGCAMGFADCNMNAADGCETATGSDVRNCGACGNACNLPNASSICIGGACQIGGCNMGFRNCNGVGNDGCEVNVGADPMNCGQCGQNCGQLPNAQASCMNGGCVVGACSPGFGDCNKVGNDGCEAPLSSDPLNCGACGKVCPAPANVAVTCVNQVCGTGTCNPGFADCNNNMADGCEAKLTADAKNCGSCGKACPVVANGTAGCIASTCGVGSCNAGFGDCDKNPANGCEASLLADNNNCGACGTVCPNGTPCANGKCGCVPTGQRVSYGTLSQDSASGCWSGNPCTQDTYNFSQTYGQNFQAFGESITCTGGAACVANVGITTYTDTKVCQGSWDVYCDGALVGTIATVGKACTGSAMGNACRVSFGARTCSSIKLVAAADGDATSNCCAGNSPDSMIVSVSAW